MKYEFTRVAARVEIIFGGLIILAGVALATLAMLPTSWIGLPFPKGPDDLLSRAARALVLFVSGLFAGALCPRAANARVPRPREAGRPD